MATKRIAWMAAAVLVCTGSWAFAAGTAVGHVCDVEFVAEKLGNPAWVILDGRTRAEYDAGHIPGAVNFGKPVHEVLRNPVDGQLVSDEKAEKFLGQIGLDNRKGLIVYGKKGDYHVSVEQFPIYLGVKEFYYLDGGIDAWLKEGRWSQTDPVTPVPAVFKAKVSNRKLYVSTYEMIRISKEKPKNLTVIDTRSRAEYDGVENTTIRGGRFPGAIHVGYEMNLDKTTHKMLPNNALQEIYKSIPKTNTVILYCHRGERTAFSFYALERLGYRNVRIYEDGWVVYGVRCDTRIEDEVYQNRRETIKQAEAVPELQERLKILEEKLKALESRQ